MHQPHGEGFGDQARAACAHDVDAFCVQDCVEERINFAGCDHLGDGVDAGCH